MEIRTGTSADDDFLAEAVTGLQRFLVPLDPEGLIKCPEGFGEEYAAELNMRVREERGIVLVALADGHRAGMVAGVIAGGTDTGGPQGQILDLYVSEDSRRAGLGSLLMEAIERYFGESGCVSAGVKVFKPNREAKQFYHRIGYEDRRELAKVFYLEKALGNLRRTAEPG